MSLSSCERSATSHQQGAEKDNFADGAPASWIGLLFCLLFPLGEQYEQTKKKNHVHYDLCVNHCGYYKLTGMVVVAGAFVLMGNYMIFHTGHGWKCCTH